ncbi:hypothetical protein MSC49_05700 [Methylosinus sp. C49]|uniref:hypothetical protein n=1 Tax=Methylosinus sp. C49 TaxID=2699395 RepID=UPI00136691A3|nr:hypothetical protein [Methylosinus sp. C49]BBU60635.1 hypothetical protein MSC49_05700 [Methylosinus sp. C49]
MRVFSLVCLALLAAAPARAEASAAEPSQSEAGRFAMSPTEGGMLRLDKQTGAVSFCTVEGGLSVCRVAAEERAALQEEIDRLARENAQLRAKLPGAAPEATAPRKGLPGEEEFERALSFTERFLRRMMQLFREEAPKGDSL